MMRAGAYTLRAEFSKIFVLMTLLSYNRQDPRGSDPRNDRIDGIVRGAQAAVKEKGSEKKAKRKKRTSA
jgi:hypothetical protein